MINRVLLLRSIPQLTTFCLYLVFYTINYNLLFKKEICDLLGDGAKPLLKDTEKLPFVEATLTEILRVAPTAPGSLPHYAVTDTEICGYKVPKGTTVITTLFCKIRIWSFQLPLV